MFGAGMMRQGDAMRFAGRKTNPGDQQLNAWRFGQSVPGPT
jgi:hypothetical protein